MQPELSLYGLGLMNDLSLAVVGSLGGEGASGTPGHHQQEGAECPPPHLGRHYYPHYNFISLGSLIWLFNHCNAQCAKTFYVHASHWLWTLNLFMFTFSKTLKQKSIISWASVTLPPTAADCRKSLNRVIATPSCLWQLSSSNQLPHS